MLLSRAITSGSSVDLPPVLGSFGPLTINTPSRWGASSVNTTSHWWAMMVNCFRYLLLATDGILYQSIYSPLFFWMYFDHTHDDPDSAASDAALLLAFTLLLLRPTSCKYFWREWATKPLQPTETRTKRWWLYIGHQVVLGIGRSRTRSTDQSRVRLVNLVSWI